MKLTIPADTIKALLLFTPKHDIRFYLMGILIDARANGDVILVATDGHRLLAVPLPVDAIESLTVGQYIIGRDALESVKPMKAGKTAFPMTLEVSADSFTLTGATTATGKPIDGKYPDWRRVMPASASGEPAQFDPDYVASFGKVAALLAGGNNPQPFIHHNGQAGALVTGLGAALGVIMPMRADATHPGLPAWALA